VSGITRQIRQELSGLLASGLYRSLANITRVLPPYIFLEQDGRETRLIDFSSNDYLGLSSHPAMKEAASRAANRWGAGSRASRLLSGNHPLYERLEQLSARLKGTEAALVFGSGYLANCGIIPALASRDDLILADRQVHASIIDGIRLSGARFKRFGHNDISHLEDLLLDADTKGFRRIVVVVESLYSMDGDMAPIEELLGLKDRFGFILMVDEAHAVGVAGAEGCGLIPRHLAEQVDIAMGTFGKALGSYGAFCASSATIRHYLINRCRTAIFSTALPPPVLAASIKAIELLPDLEMERHTLAQRSRQLVSFIRNELAQEAIGEMQIVSLVLGSSERAVRLEAFLRQEGIFARAIRPPTVPKGRERIRFSITSCHSREDIDILKKALAHFFSVDSAQGSEGR
jgi:8-amino-7-oxononanoate synthase